MANGRFSRFTRANLTKTSGIAPLAQDWFFGAAGPVGVAVTLAETLSFSESTSSQAGRRGTRTETETLTSAESARGAYRRSEGETLTTTSVQSAQGSYLRTLGEVLNFLDSQTAFLTPAAGGSVGGGGGSSFSNLRRPRKFLEDEPPPPEAPPPAPEPLPSPLVVAKPNKVLRKVLAEALTPSSSLPSFQFPPQSPQPSGRLTPMMAALLDDD